MSTITNTEPIVIDDWESPRFSAAATELLAQLANSAPDVPLTPEVVLAGAIAETGLSDFGGDWFREPLALLCESLNADFELSAPGRAIALGMLVRMARNRLRLTDVIARHPEIVEVEIDRPVFVVGLPRTGTSHLTNLIAADPGIRSMRYWESLEPVLPDPQPTSAEDDPRLARAREMWGIVDCVLPYQKALHEMSPEHVHEDIELLGMSFASNLFEGMLGPVRRYTDWFKSADLTPAYRYFKTTLQAMQWLRGGRRWVLKTPGHLEHLKALTTVFPDAICVFTHRDPVTITASCVTMETYLGRLTVASDFRQLGDYWCGRVQDFMRSAVNNRHLCAARPEPGRLLCGVHERSARDRRADLSAGGTSVH